MTMKFIFFLACMILNSIFGFSQINQIQKVSAPIKDVTVFLTGGEITRVSEIKLVKGRNKLVFTGISTVIDQKSIQFIANESVNLVSVSTEVDYLSFTEDNPRIKKLNDSLKMYKSNRTNFNDEKQGYTAEMQLLRANISIKGAQNNLSAEELRTMAEFYRKRMIQLNKTVTEYDNNIKSLDQKIYKIENQLIELNYQEKIHSNQVIVIVEVDKDIQVPIILKYIISNCGWQANYDVLAKDVSGKINIKYKAKVYNNTGNDWSKVNLKLSTSNPNLSATAPILDTWFLNNRTISNSFKKGKTIMVPENRGYDKYYQNSSAPEMSQNISQLSDGRKINGVKGNVQQSPTVRFQTIEVPQLSTEFKIERNYTIPSDSKPYLVEISEHELVASYSHKAVPKLDKDAFLLANVVGWEKLNLISGPTNVYYSGNYVGQSYINTRNIDDTLSLSLGRDEKVLINKKILEEFSSRRVIGANKKDTYTYEIVVKNNLGINLQMDLFDQIPISQQSDISVSVDEVSGAIQNEETGILSWNVNLEPNETATYKISFTIKYPKDKKIQVNTYRTISCPSF